MPVTTHPSNANVHPGQIIYNTGQKQHTKAEKAADDKHLHEELQEKEAAAIQGIECLAKIQATMEESQASMTNKKPKAVRLCAVRKPVAASLKEARPALGESQGEDRLGQESTTTTASKATTVKSQFSHEKSTLDVPENVLVGRFDDVDSEVDKLLECKAALQSTKRGRMPVKMMDSIEEIPPPPIQPRQSTHLVTPLNSSVLQKLASEDADIMFANANMEDSESDMIDITDNIGVDNSIFVTTTDIKVPPSKKIKFEPVLVEDIPSHHIPMGRGPAKPLSH
ncbi:hypothetical protein BDR04DRAFT_1115822 [Suillus decipiens]|nr:hypothetical protein BDR04DRAFT_1115822 [Suillus decipiens]